MPEATPRPAAALAGRYRIARELGAGGHGVGVTCSDTALTVDLADGRRLSVPLSWYPRLAQETGAERTDWQLTGRGQGIHWPALDEDILVADLLEARRSTESGPSLE